MNVQPALWGIFAVLVIIALALDLGVFHKKAHQPSFKEALIWTLVWVALSLAFAGLTYFLTEQQKPGSGEQLTLAFVTGYLIEKSLSLDNIFVMAVVFRYFKIPPKYQHTVLYWGILGAVVFRAIVIIAGTAIFAKITWAHYIFGIILLYSAYKMLAEVDEEDDLENNLVVRWVKKLMPLALDASPEKFVVVRQGILHMTPLLLCLLVIEVTDVMFALDSVPAIFSITTNFSTADTFFIVFTSNIFAILGLRALYFVLAAGLDKFRYLKAALVLILSFVGVKLLVQHHYEIPIWLSLTIILTSLTGGVILSLLISNKEEKATVERP